MTDLNENSANFEKTATAVQSTLVKFWGQQSYQGFQARLLSGVTASAATCIGRGLKYNLVSKITWALLLMSLRNLPRIEKGSPLVFAPTATNVRAVQRVLELLQDGVAEFDPCIGSASIWSRLSAFKLRGFQHDLRALDPFVRIQCVTGHAAVSYFWNAFLKCPPSSVVVANDHSPISVALMYVSKEMGVPLVYVQHAPVNDNYPELIADLSILFDQHSLDIYSAIGGSCRDVAILSPFDPVGRPVAVQHSLECWGILLSRVPDIAGVSTVIRDLKTRFSSVRIVIRPHPAVGQVPDGIMIDQKVTVHSGPMNEFARLVDVVVAPGSGAIAELLHEGTPVIYRSDLDGVGFDPHGLVRDGIVLDGTNIALSDIPQRLCDFYDEDWHARLSQKLDAQDIKSQERVVRDKLHALLDVLP
ncbi:hypothetical protein BVC71_02950 [Marivivens niveibacter]|uniref:Uncharacterized protein n=1 Tax=Marivivens niveibacter TaxID=1930667 RepID=A0A251X1M5_9RHOB|nr:hypothetical protein [Marivivens niveibacter]OUD10471.1 hypothetical protein BVC71_02950 [Marivivens niveibacter]